MAMKANTHYDHAHPVYEVEVVFVPTYGDFLVRDGKVLPVDEIELEERDKYYMRWNVWTEREAEDE